MNKTVLVIAKSELPEIYKNIIIDGIEADLCPFNDAFEAIGEITADVVLIDSDSDTGRGFELIRMLKSAHPGIPVIFITSKSSEETVIRAFRSGVRGYFKTPVNMLELKATIKGLLKLKEKSTEHRSPLFMDGSIGDLTTIVPATTPPNMLRAVSLIMNNLSAKLTLDELAKEALMSKFHFCRSFHKHFGMSPMKFVTRMRIKRSQELLMGKNMPVSTIACEVGYNDTGNFIRHFKRFTGQTPTAYRSLSGKQ